MSLVLAVSFLTVFFLMVSIFGDTFLVVSWAERLREKSVARVSRIWVFIDSIFIGQYVLLMMQIWPGALTVKKDRARLPLFGDRQGFLGFGMV
jgi:hypothetical protein